MFLEQVDTHEHCTTTFTTKLARTSADHSNNKKPEGSCGRLMPHAWDLANK